MSITILMSNNRFWKLRIQKIFSELHISYLNNFIKLFNCFADAYPQWRVDLRAYRPDFRGIELQHAALAG